MKPARTPKLRHNFVCQSGYTNPSCMPGHRRHLFRGAKKPAPILIPRASEEWHREVEQHPDMQRDPPKSVCILGGGISGLTAAFNLSRFSPETKITLLEASDRAGGWVQSHQIPTSKGSIVFESGPRTLRPWTVNGIVTIDLVRNLNIESQMLLVPKTSPAAQNRYIYFQKQLNKLPHSLGSLLPALRLPVLKGVMGGVFKEPFRRRRSKDVEDESVESFLSRRFGSSLANNLVSAVFHGIYAGDISKLSADALCHEMYRNERIYGSVLRGAIGVQEARLDDKLIREMYVVRAARLLNDMKGTSIYGFKGGMETLTKALDVDVKNKRNVSVETGVRVSSCNYNKSNKKIEVTREDGKREEYDFVLSALPASKTATLLPEGAAETLSEIESVTVMVVNLFFGKPNIAGIEGFGYLIPKSVPLEDNPHRALGVIFDTSALPGQDERQGSKLTVMLGGHWWGDSDDYPSESEGVRIARDVLKNHLGITEPPIESRVNLQKDCIPQYTVGHAGRLRQIHEDLMENMGGRLVLAGNSYGGVGLNDAIRSARDAAFDIAAGQPMTGMERWAYEEQWVSKHN